MTISSSVQRRKLFGWDYASDERIGAEKIPWTLSHSEAAARKTMALPHWRSKFVTPLSFEVQAMADGVSTQLRVVPSAGSARDYRIAGGDPEHYAEFYADLARDFGI